MRSYLQDVNVEGVDFVGSAANLRTFALLKAQWTQAFIDDLPDASFAIIEPGGAKDDEGKTTPRAKRHLPYKDASGKVDLPHLRNALARLDQTDVPDAAKAAARTKLEAAAKAAGVGGEAAKSISGGGPMKLSQSEFQKRLADQGIDLELDDAKLASLAKGLGIELTETDPDADEVLDVAQVEKSTMARFLKALRTALGITAEETTPLDKSKLPPEAREYVSGLETRLSTIEKANREAARVALTKRITELRKSGWLDVTDEAVADVTEPEVAAIEKARDRVLERLKKAGVLSSFGTPAEGDDEPTSARELVQKAIREQLGREPRNRTEAARIKKEIYDANPGLLEACLQEERTEKARGAA